MGRGYPPWTEGVPTLDEGRATHLGGEGTYLGQGEGVPTLDGGRVTYLGERGTYLGCGEVPTLDVKGYLPWMWEGYLLWMGSTYLGWGGSTYVAWGNRVPTLDGGREYLAWKGEGTLERLLRLPAGGLSCKLILTN